jgi:AAA+ superfamily predicted ATPase
VQTAPANSLIVMEDVDALFSRDRASANDGKTPLTFSGLLNALDGVCNPEGQVFVLTTNHIERLDPALIRPGRVDLKVRFGTATRQQAAALFVNFYPGEVALGEKFADVIASRGLHAKDNVKEQQLKQGEGEGEDAQEKRPVVADEDQGLGVSMAALQQLFILCRKNTPAEAVEQARTFHF